jgi:hypothetical protein
LADRGHFGDYRKPNLWLAPVRAVF